MATILLPNGATYDTELALAEQTAEAQQYIKKNYTERDFEATEDENGRMVKEMRIVLPDYIIARKRIWKNNRFQGEEIETRVNEDSWHYEDRPLRLFLPDAKVSQGMIADANFKAVVDYALSPPEGIELSKVRTSTGHYVYLNDILPEHEAILQTQGIEVVNQPEA